MKQDNQEIPLHERVNLLFATIIDSEGHEPRNDIVAHALTEALGRTVTVTDVQALRQPDAECEDEELLTALAQYFDMPGAYLSSEPTEYSTMDTHLRMLIAQRDKRIPFVALRASDDKLSDEAVRELTKYLESLE